MNQENVFKILNEISTQIENLKNEINSKNKYNNLIEEIKSNDDLKFLFNDNNECDNHIHNCILNVNRYPFLNEYINLYFERNPEKINEQCKDSRYYLYTPLMIVCSLLDGISQTTMNIILKYSPNLEIKNNNGSTALFFICAQKNTDTINNMLSLLINKGANIKIKNNSNLTPFNFLCRNKYANDYSFKLFLEKNIDLNYNKYGKRALLDYIRYNNDNPSFIILLNNYGFNFNNYDDSIIIETILNHKYKCLEAIIPSYIKNTEYNKRKIIDLLHNLGYINKERMNE